MPHGAPCPCIGKEQLKALREERRRLELEWRNAEDLLRREQQERGKLQRIYTYLIKYLPQNRMQILPTPSSKGVYYKYDVIPPTPAAPLPSKRPKPGDGSKERLKYEQHREKQDRILRDLERLYEAEKNLPSPVPTAAPYYQYETNQDYFVDITPPPATKARIIAKKKTLIKDIEEELPYESPLPHDDDNYDAERRKIIEERKAIEREARFLEEQRLAAEEALKTRRRKFEESEREKIKQERSALKKQREKLEMERKLAERLRKDEEDLMLRKGRKVYKDLEAEKRRLEMLTEKLRLEREQSLLEREKERRRQEEEARKRLEEEKLRLIAERNKKEREERLKAVEAERQRLEKIRLEQENQRLREEKQKLDSENKARKAAELREKEAREKMKQKLLEAQKVEANKKPKVDTIVEVRVEKKVLTEELRKLQLEEERMNRELAALMSESIPSSGAEDQALKLKEITLEKEKIKVQQDEDRRRLAELGLEPGVIITQTTTQKSTGSNSPKANSKITSSISSNPSVIIGNTVSSTSSTTNTTKETSTGKSNLLPPADVLERRRLRAEKLRKEEEAKKAAEKEKLAAEKQAAQDAEVKRQAEFLAQAQANSVAQQVQANAKAGTETANVIVNSNSKPGQVDQLQETGLVIGRGSTVSQTKAIPTISTGTQDLSRRKAAANETARKVLSSASQQISNAQNPFRAMNLATLTEAQLLEEEKQKIKEDVANLAKVESQLIRPSLVPAKPVTNEQEALLLEKKANSLVAQKNIRQKDNQEIVDKLIFLNTQPKNETVKTTIEFYTVLRKYNEKDLELLDFEIRKIERELAWIRKKIVENARQSELSDLKNTYRVQQAEIKLKIDELEGLLRSLASKPSTTEILQLKNDYEKQRIDYIRQWELLQSNIAGADDELKWLSVQEQASKTVEEDARKTDQLISELRRDRRDKDKALLELDRQLQSIIRSKTKKQYTPMDIQKFDERLALLKAINALRKQEIDLTNQLIRSLNSLVSAKYALPTSLTTKKFTSKYTPVLLATSSPSSSPTPSTSVLLTPSSTPSPKPTICDKICLKNIEIQKRIERKKLEALERKRLKDLAAAEAAEKKRKNHARAAKLKEKLMGALKEKGILTSKMGDANITRDQLEKTINDGKGTEQTKVEMNIILEEIRKTQARLDELAHLEKDLIAQILALQPDFGKPKRLSRQVSQMNQTSMLFSAGTNPAETNALIPSVNSTLTAKTTDELQSQLMNTEESLLVVDNEIAESNNRRNQLQHTIDIGRATSKTYTDLEAIIENLRKLEAHKQLLIQLEKKIRAEQLKREQHRATVAKKIAELQKRREELARRRESLIANPEHVTVITKKKLVDGKVVETTEERKPGIHSINSQS